MVKFVEYWMFATHLWQDAPPTPCVINLREITCITEMCSNAFGVHSVVALNDDSKIPIEGNIIDILAEFQKHLSNMY